MFGLIFPVYALLHGNTDCSDILDRLFFSALNRCTKQSKDVFHLSLLITNYISNTPGVESNDKVCKRVRSLYTSPNALFKLVN